MRAAVAIPAATRWTDRRVAAVRFAMLSIVASLGVENDHGDVCERGSEEVVGGEGGKNGSDRLFVRKNSSHRSVVNLRIFRVHPTESPIRILLLKITCLIAEARSRG